MKCGLLFREICGYMVLERRFREGGAIFLNDALVANVSRRVLPPFPHQPRELRMLSFQPRHQGFVPRVAL